MNIKDWYVTSYVKDGSLKNRYPQNPKRGECWNFKFAIGMTNPNETHQEQIKNCKWVESELMQYDGAKWVKADSY